MEVRNELHNRIHMSFGYPLLVIESDAIDCNAVRISMEDEKGELIGSVIEVRGYELIKAVENAMNH